MNLSIIGTVGIPNKYGGFESFISSCSSHFHKYFTTVTVTCCYSSYESHEKFYNGVCRKFIKIPANGVYSIIHDLVAFLSIYPKSTHILVLGVSGGIWFPFFRFLCLLFNKKLVVNIDGVEWRRSKFSSSKKFYLKLSDYFAQKFSHHVIYDNKHLYNYLYLSSKSKCSLIAYPGDHVLHLGQNYTSGTAVTICRIEPENNIEMLIKGFLNSKLKHYKIVGNWSNSNYGKRIRSIYSNLPNLSLVDPVYDSHKIAQLRESCHFYLHGHQVGGTNPSLVEMLFYNANILCYDVCFNRETAGDAAGYFQNSDELTKLINANLNKNNSEQILLFKKKKRSVYTTEKIVSFYVKALFAL